MATTGLLGLLINPLFWLIVGPVMMYIILLASVKGRGTPIFARKLPLASRFYPIEVPILEIRAGGWKWTKTWGRIVALTGKWHILETLDRGNLMVPPKRAIISGGGHDVIPFVSPEEEEYHPIIGVEQINSYEELSVPEKDKNGDVIKEPLLYEDGTPILDRDGFPAMKIKMKKVKQYIYKPLTQSQRVFLRAEADEAAKKYTQKAGFWDKIMPYVGIVLMGAFIVILTGLLLQNMGEIATEMAKVAESTSGVRNIPQIPIQNISW